MNYFFAFRHPITVLTLTRAIPVISAYALNKVYRQNPVRGSLTFVEDTRAFGFFRPASCSTACCRGSVTGSANIVRCSC